MLRTRRLSLVAVLVVFGATSFVAQNRGPARTPAAAPPSAAIVAALNALEPTLADEFARDGIGGASIGVVSGAELVWSKHYGYADPDAKRVPTNDSAYRIGSITKQFTALALMQLAEQGKLRLTDPVVKHVPEIARVQNATADAPPITLLQLATMTSGLAREPGCANHSVGPVSGWVQKVLDCLPETRYQHPPGTQYLYSNIGYATLGIAIERAAGRSFAEVVSTGIFKPLGMPRSAFEPTPDIRRDLAHGFQRNRNTGQASRTIPDQKLDGRGYRVPNGAIFSTVNDLAKFLAWELGEGPDSVLDRRTQEANYTRVYTATVPENGQLVGAGYGVGFMLSRRGDILMLGHGGSTEGYHAAALFHRATKLGVVVLRGCDTCAFDASPVASRVLERAVVAARDAVRENRE